MAEIKIAWGKDAGGELIHISSLPKGIGRSCGLVCPDCDNPLEARQGDIKRWHFAHAVTTECQGETVLHKVAKQVLLKAAESFKKLRLPARVVNRTRVDILSYEHHSSGVFPEQLSLLSGAREEVRLRSGQVADAVVTTEALHPRPLVVEVFVTHQKSMMDVERFRSLDLDAIEIDISALDWNASFPDIEQAVLNTAPRQWLHTNLDTALASEAFKEAERKAAEKSQQYVAALEQQVFELASLSPSDFGSLSWPELSARAEGKDSSGKTHVGISSVRLQVDSFPAEWRQRDGLWWASTTVKRIPVDLAAVMAGQAGWSQLVEPKVTKPTLVVFLPVLDEIEDFNIEFQWLGVEKWQARLKSQAHLVLAEKLNEANKLNSNVDSFIQRFENLDDSQRLDFLHAKFGIPPAATPGRPDNAWKVPPTIWRRLVWRYSILSARDILSTEWIATDRWLQRLLGFSNDEVATQQRKKTIWFFLKKFEEHGWIRHIGRQQLEVKTNLKDKGWEPWMDDR